MIQRLLIRDFQAHELLDLKLDRVTVLVGDSDVGKSSVLRAIRWLVTNKPGGIEFIRDGSEKTEVRLKVDSQTITRERGKENIYRLGKHEFKAFGASVPDPIQQVLNLDGELNFQDQHDAVFWFSLSPGETAKRLNATVNLEGIDRVMGESQRLSRKATNVREVLEDQQRKAAQTMVDLDYVRRLQRDWNACEEQQEQFEQLQTDLVQLGSLVRDLRSNRLRAKQLKGIAQDFMSIEQQQQTCLKANQDRLRLQQAIKAVERAKLSIASFRDDLDEAEQDLKKAAKKERICPTCGQPIKSR